MNFRLQTWLMCAALCYAAGAPAQQNVPPESAIETPAPPERPQWPRPRDREGRRGNAVVSIGHDSRLEADERAEAVVSIMGSSTSAGEVSQAVVSIFGNSTATGPVGESVVSIFGNTYVDSRVGQEAVAVFGSVELGPNADVRDVVSVFGEIKRDPQARIRGETNQVAVGTHIDFEWLRPWVDHALLYGRPLALAPGLAWAWWLAFSFLGLYVLLAVAARPAVERCVQTLQTQPGRSIVAALLTLLLTPIAFILLAITVVGIAVIPFLGIALFCAGLFGKTVMLAWLGGRCTQSLRLQGPFGHVAFAVLIGGLIVLAIYLVPFVGFIVYKLLGMLGLGVVVYTLIQATKHHREPQHATLATETATVGTAAAPDSSTFTATVDASTPSNATAATAQPVTTALPRAGFWIRMGALLIDIILVGVVSSIVHIHILLLLATYGAVMWKLKGATIGGIICDLRLVRLDGKEIDWPTAIVRALSCFVSLVVAGLGFFWIAFDDERQAWHDKIAGTVVVRTPKGVPLL